ncbi:MAG: amidohydrolase family protein [Bacteroidia bacterium]
MKNYLCYVGTIFCLVFLIIVSPGLLWSQNKASELSPVTNTFAITHVNVIQSPGVVLEDVTVIVKNGLIVSVGKDVAIPGEAEVMAADSMYLYAGFVGGLSHLGIPRTETARNSGEERTRPENPVNPPADVAGIQTDRKAVDLFDPSDKSIAAMREAGFTSAHVVPRGKMLPGSGMIVLLGEGKANQLVLRENTSQFSQFTGAPGVYPATLLGVMAKWKELYSQTKYAMEHEAAYAKNPAGVRHPEYDPTLQALYPVVRKELPVVFKTENVLDIQRAISMQKEMGFSLMLAECKQGWELTDKIKSQNIPVFLSLDLPKEVEEKPVRTGKAEETATKEETPAEKEKAELEKRRLEAYKLYASQASAFEKAGITFGFSMLEAKPKDILSQIRIMIKYGLSENAALAALTTNPASLLGLSNVMGTVEKGKMANLVITDKPVFAEKSAIKYVFVDGKKYVMSTKPAGSKSATNPDAVKAVVGKWNIVTRSQMGERPGVLVIKNEGGALSGTISFEGSNGQMSNDLDVVEFDGKELTFSYTFDMRGQSAEIEATAAIEGNKLSGTMTFGEFGSFPIEGEKESSPENN